MIDDRWRDSYDVWKLASPYDDEVWDAAEDDEPIDLGFAEWIDDLDERCGP